MSDAQTVRIFSSSEALRFGYEKTRANLKPLLIIGAVGAFLALFNSALSNPNARGGLSSLLSLVIQVGQTAVMLAFMRVSLRIHDGEAVDVSRPGALLTDFLTFLLTTVLYGLIVAGGSLLLIVPGVIWGLMFACAPFLVADKGRLDPIAALRESRRLTQGVKGELFVFALLCFAVNLLGAIALGIGLFLTIPTTFIASAYVYRRLQARAVVRAEAPAPPLVHAPVTSH